MREEERESKRRNTEREGMEGEKIKERNEEKKGCEELREVEKEKE